MARTPTDQPTVTDRPPRAAPTRALAAGDTIDRYELVEELGAGGMGVVFHARDPQLGRSVAIKVLRDPTHDRAQRLIREAQAMAQLSHENLVVVYDAGTDAGHVFLAMELVDGTSLRKWLGDSGRTWRDKLRAVIAAGRGLAAAHTAGIVHRDFKPENVLVDRGGRIKVADFGLARAELTPAAAPTTDAPEDLTRTGSLMGTPAYMAPEQYAGKLAEPRSDQFALAVTAWEAVWSVRPFRGEYLALADAIQHGTITPPPSQRGVPARLQAVLRRALAVDPDARFPTVNDLLDEIERAIRAPRRWPLVIAVATVAAGALAATLWRAGMLHGPEVPLDAVDVTVDRGAGVIDEVIRDHGDQVVACVATAHAGRAHGLLRLGFEIAPDGHVRSVEIVRDAFPGTSVARCAAAAAMAWEFPPGTATSVIVPFKL